MATEPWTVKRQMTGTVDVVADEKLWVYYGPSGDKITLVEVKVPSGKKWSATVTVDVTETDVV